MLPQLVSAPALMLAWLWYRTLELKPADQGLGHKAGKLPSLSYHQFNLTLES
jgi:hypothetical protein